MTLDITLQHRFNSFALDVAFRAPPGVTALYGRSGSGKTTIINAMSGLFAPNQGHIRCDGDVLFDSAFTENQFVSNGAAIALCGSIVAKDCYPLPVGRG